MRRRDFLTSGASLAGAMLLGGGERILGQTPNATRIGLQLYSVRNSLAKVNRFLDAPLGMTPRVGGIEAFEKLLRSEYERWAKVVKQSGAKVD